MPVRQSRATTQRRPAEANPSGYARFISFYEEVRVGGFETMEGEWVVFILVVFILKDIVKITV